MLHARVGCLLFVINTFLLILPIESTSFREYTRTNTSRVIPSGVGGDNGVGCVSILTYLFCFVHMHYSCPTHMLLVKCSQSQKSQNYVRVTCNTIESLSLEQNLLFPSQYFKTNSLHKLFYSLQ